MRHVFHWFIALALLPCVWASIVQVGAMASGVGSEGFRAWWVYALGAGVYLAGERILTKPMWLYVVGHEMTHVVSGLVSGARIHSFKAGSRGGEVRLSKSNAFIALSPYIIPFYTLVVIGIYAVARRWWNPPALTDVFHLLLGMSLAFHFSLTVSAFHVHQPDLKVLGYFLSGVLILLGNILIVGLFGVSLFSKTPTLKQFSAGIGRDTLLTWKKTITLMKEEIIQWTH